jgi:DNA-binding beta-propeller fold protein YncE
MTTLTRLLRALGATLAVVGLVLPGASVALANGLGDLYVAVPGGVDEVFLAGQQIVTTVDVTGGGSDLAFTNDGAFLFVVDASGGLGRINIEEIRPDQSYTLAKDAVAVAHPKGTALFIALKDDAALAVLPRDETTTSEGPTLSGAADILAADPHENRFVAAQSGHSWLDIVEPSSAHVTRVQLDGDIVAVAIARAEGYAYVAMEGPNQVARVSLATGAVDWKADLSGAPSALAAVPEAAVVAVGDALFRVKDGQAAPWSTAATGIKGLVTQLSASYEGAYVYVATEDAILAINEAQPDSAPAAEVAVAGAAFLAPIPKESSLYKGRGAGTGPGSSAGAGNATGTGAGNSASQAPATDTEGDRGPLWHRSGRDPLLPIGVGAAIVVGVLLCSRALLKRTILE